MLCSFTCHFIAQSVFYKLLSINEFLDHSDSVPIQKLPVSLVMKVALIFCILVSVSTVHVVCYWVVSKRSYPTHRGNSHHSNRREGNRPKNVLNL